MRFNRNKNQYQCHHYIEINAKVKFVSTIFNVLFIYKVTSFVVIN